MPLCFQPLSKTAFTLQFGYRLFPIILFTCGMFGTGVFEHSAAFRPFWTPPPPLPNVCCWRQNMHEFSQSKQNQCGWHYVKIAPVSPQLCFHPGDSPPKGVYSSLFSFCHPLICPLLSVFHLSASERCCATDVSKNFLTNIIETTSAKFSWFSSVELSIGTTSPSIHVEAGRFNFNHLSSRVPPPTFPSEAFSQDVMCFISVSISVPRRPQIWAWYSLHCFALSAHSCFGHLIYPFCFALFIFYILFIFNFVFQF